MNILIFIVILLVIVLIHELGHFLTAKKFGIKVEEFGFGFPPKLFGIKKGETEYTFNLLPIGGFVKIFGENPDDENTNGPEKDRSFVHKSAWKQAIVLVAGVTANFLLAWVLFSFGFMSGLPTSAGSERAGYKLQDVNLVVVSVLEDSPAKKTGLETGDKIINIKNKNNFAEIVNPEVLKSFVTESGDDGIYVGYTRGKNAEIKNVQIVPRENKETGKKEIGIAMDQIGIAKLPFFVAFWEGMKLNINMTLGTVMGLFNLVKEGLMGKGSFDAVTGPVGMVGIVGDAYQFGFVYLLSFAALISINLAVINLLPFPALDGGRLFFLLIEKIKGSRLNPKFANTANMIGFSLLMLLMLVITYRDIVKLF